jgi:hypothetical protein
LVLILIHRNADCNPRSGITSIIEIIAVIGINDIDIIVFIPIVGPRFRPRIKHIEPIPVILKTRISAIHFHVQAIEAETVVSAEVTVVMVFGNTKAAIAAAIGPGAVLALPVAGAVLLPHAMLFALLDALRGLGSGLPFLHAFCLRLRLVSGGLCLLFLKARFCRRRLRLLKRAFYRGTFLQAISLLPVMISRSLVLFLPLCLRLLFFLILNMLRLLLLFLGFLLGFLPGLLLFLLNLGLVVPLPPLFLLRFILLLFLTLFLLALLFLRLGVLLPMFFLGINKNRGPKKKKQNAATDLYDKAITIGYFHTKFPYFRTGPSKRQGPLK